MSLALAPKMILPLSAPADQAIDINPSFAWTYNNLADGFIRQRRLDEAIVEYRRGIKINPGSA